MPERRNTLFPEDQLPSVAGEMEFRVAELNPLPNAACDLHEPPCPFSPSNFDLVDEAINYRLTGAKRVEAASKGVSAMRLHMHSIAASAAVLIGMALTHASATQIDADYADYTASAVRGSLGVPLEDLTLSSGAGASLFFLNAGFALSFGVIAFMMTRREGWHTRKPPRPAAHMLDSRLG
jgi:hypothetical protein